MEEEKRVRFYSFGWQKFSRRAGPVLAGFVMKPEGWKYSSVREVCEMQGWVNLSYGQYSRHSTLGTNLS
ncbi:hypothetical protein BH20BAC1_BH20BAC1_19640 [soil metagenome]